MTDPLEHILRLAFEVGPRPATSKGERRASAYIAEKLEEFGFTVKVEQFRAPRSMGMVLAPIYLLALAGVGIELLLNSAALGLLLCGIALVAFLGEITTALRLVSLLVPKGKSQNVIARLAPKELPRRRLVIAAHYDSPRPDLGWHPRVVRARRLGFVLLALSLLMLPLVIAVSAATGFGGIAFAATPFAVYVLGALLLLLHGQIAYKHVPGANCDASGVAVMLTLCEALALDAPADTEVMALACGCNTTGVVGMQAFIRKHADELDRAWILNLDSVGAGDVFYTTSEGQLLNHRTSPELREVAEMVAALPDLGVTARSFHLVRNDIEPVLLRGLDAISVMAGNDGVPVNSHWKTDTVENIDPDSIDTAYRFTEAMVRRLIA